jgi:tetratricopeptide (TPR) repeat protein
VFRFTNQSGQADIDWMRDGLPDMLTTTLSRSVTLDVLSRDQLAMWLGRIGDQGLPGALELARRSQAQIAILGSFAQTGSSIRVEAQVYDGTSGKLLAADRLVADPPEQILTLVDQLAARLAGRLTAQLPGPALPESMTGNLPAYRAYSLGLAQAEVFHTDAALELFKQAIALDPEFEMAHARIGYTHAISAGRIAEGRPYLEHALRRSSRLTERNRRQVLAWYAIANQNYREAIARYRELVAAHPREVESYHRLAVLLRGESLHEESVEVLKQGLAIDSEAARLWNSLAAAQSERGRHKEAIEAARRYLKLTPGEANAYDSLALSYYFAGDFDGALDALSQALRLNPRFAAALSHRQIVLAAAGRFREALEIAKTPPPDMDSARFRNQAAWLLWRLGRESEARAAIQSIDIGLYPWNPATLLVPDLTAKMRRSAMPGRGGRWGLRNEFFFAAQEARLEKRRDEMLASLRELVRHRPSWGAVEIMEDALADGLLETGKVGEAIAEYRRALQLYPGMALARFHLGQALLRSGDRAGASEHFSKFLELWKNADSNLTQLGEARRLSP